ncbi:IS200/IS605 family transposase [archaeon SCG-AAA382B04]|nr:IS200/IS605 family transposase [archaeon SCG-AAA382B04]
MKSTRYAHYNINYHFVWIPKYRDNVLTNEIKEYLNQTLKTIAKDKDGVEIKSIDIQPDHVHLFVSAKPMYSPSKLINIFKGASSRKLRNQFPDLKAKDKLWTRTYYVGTAGKVSEKNIKRYIEECQ